VYNGGVTLTDQFQSFQYIAEFLVYFANPVEKRHGALNFPINRPDLHYAWWKIRPETVVGLPIVVNNQFGEQTLLIDRALYLLNPALKNEASDIPIPVANHYKCYACSGQPVNATVFLIDQFFARPAVVLSPRFFCTPVRKDLPAGGSFPVIEPDQHYTVYDIDPTQNTWTANFRDQFIQGPIALTNDQWLMVPSNKTGPTDVRPSTWGRLKAQFR
jgi:hypothetical protein